MNDAEENYQRTISTWDGLGQWYEDNFLDDNSYDYTYDYLLTCFPEGQIHVLDLACGPGLIGRYLVKHRNDLFLTCADASANMVERAEKNCKGATGIVMDMRNLKNYDAYFDCICIGFGIPYLAPKDASDLIETCYQKLNSKGVFYLSYITLKLVDSVPVSAQQNANYMFCYREETIDNILKKCGFTILKSFNHTYMKGKTQEEQIIVVAQKGI